MAKSTKNTVPTAEDTRIEAEQHQQPEFVVYNADSENTSATLSDLIALDSTPIENASLAMRELNQQHVSHMIEALKAGKTLPPLTVVDTSWGTVVLDGLHRWTAYEKYLKQVLDENQGEGEGEHASKETVKMAREQYFIPVQQKQVNGPFDMLQTSFHANLDHGLPSSDTSRSRYALWLIAESNARGDKPVLSMRKAAEIAGVTHAAVSKFAKRLRENASKMIDVKFSDEDEAEIESSEDNDVSTVESKEYAKAEKHLNNMLKAVKYFQKTDMTSTEMHRFVESFGKETTKEAIDEVYSLLSYIKDAAPYAPSPEQKELIQTNIQEPEVFHVG